MKSSNTVEWLHVTDTKNIMRFVLGEKGSKNIACIGVNPSTAHPNELNNTIKSVKRISGSMDLMVGSCLIFTRRFQPTLMI